MGADSKIEWCDHTFNTWWGCARVSPGCVNCYADTNAARWGHQLWRRHGPRKPMSDQYWRAPVRWNRAGPARVFCGSMCDVFEAHPAPEVRAMQDTARERLWDLIDMTADLTWMLLTKRPENIQAMTPSGGFPLNVWLGTSVEDQRRADERCSTLLGIPTSHVRFLSCEPLLSPVDLSRYLTVAPVSDRQWCPTARRHTCPVGDIRCTCTGGHIRGQRIRWVIAGGESGPKARPMHPDWARALRDQAVATRTAFHFKQRGQFTWDAGQDDPFDPDTYVCAATGRVADEATALADGGQWQGVWNVGKTRAGRLLDGRVWDEFPTDNLGWPL